MKTFIIMAIIVLIMVTCTAANNSGKNTLDKVKACLDSRPYSVEYRDRQKDVCIAEVMAGKWDR